MSSDREKLTKIKTLIETGYFHAHDPTSPGFKSAMFDVIWAVLRERDSPGSQGETLPIDQRVEHVEKRLDGTEARHDAAEKRLDMLSRRVFALDTLLLDRAQAKANAAAARVRMRFWNWPW